MPTIHLHARTVLLIARDAARRARVDAARPNALTSDSILAVAMSAAATEAFINEFAHYAPTSYGSLAPEQAPPAIMACAQVLEDLEESRVAVTAKYLVASQVLSGKPFDAGAAPFQDFKMLIDLRNAIMHIKATSKGERHAGQRVTDSLAQRGLAIPGKEPGSLPWFDRLMTPEAATWAHDSAIAIIRGFLALVPQRDYYDPLQHYRESFNEHPSVED